MQFSNVQRSPYSHSDLVFANLEAIIDCIKCNHQCHFLLCSFIKQASRWVSHSTQHTMDLTLVCCCQDHFDTSKRPAVSYHGNVFLPCAACLSIVCPLTLKLIIPFHPLSLQEHLTGKQFLGWKQIREVFAELTTKLNSAPPPRSSHARGGSREREEPRRERERERSPGGRGQSPRWVTCFSIAGASPYSGMCTCGFAFVTASWACRCPLSDALWFVQSTKDAKPTRKLRCCVSRFL